MKILNPNQLEKGSEVSRRGALGIITGAIVAMTNMKTLALSQEVQVLKVSKVESSFGIVYAKLIEEKFGSPDPELATLLTSIEKEFLEYDPKTKQASFEKLMNEFISQLKDGKVSPKNSGTLTRRSPRAYGELGQLILARGNKALAEGNKALAEGKKALAEGNQAKKDAEKLKKIADSL